MLLTFADSTFVDTPFKLAIYGGVILRADDYIAFSKIFAEFLKQNKLNEIRIDRVGIDTEKQFIQMLSAHPFISFLVMTDNDALKQQYAQPANYINYAFELLMERFAMYARSQNLYCLVIHDHEKVTDFREILKFWKKSSYDPIFNRDREEFKHILDTILVAASTESSGVQLADNIARAGRGLIKSFLQGNTNVPNKEFVKFVFDRLHKNVSGQTRGYGLKITPEINLNTSNLLQFVSSI